MPYDEPNKKFTVGDYFVFIAKGSSGFKIIGVITETGSEGRFGIVHYKPLKCSGNTSHVIEFSDFGVNSSIYHNSRIITEKEAILEAL